MRLAAWNVCLRNTGQLSSLAVTHHEKVPPAELGPSSPS